MVTIRQWMSSSGMEWRRASSPGSERPGQLFAVGITSRSAKASFRAKTGPGELYLFASSFIKGTDECVQLLDGYRHSDRICGKAGRGWRLYAVEMKVGIFFRRGGG